MNAITPNVPEQQPAAPQTGQATDAAKPALDPRAARAELWLRRLALVVEVIFFVELGMLLVVLPWTELWSRNIFVAQHFKLREILDMGFVKGALTGLGFVNIWIGIWDAVHYREEPPAS